MACHRSHSGVSGGPIAAISASFGTCLFREGGLRLDWTGGELSACDPLGLGAFIRVLNAWPLVGMKHRVGQAQRSVWHKTRGSESDPFSLLLPFPSCW